MQHVLDSIVEETFLLQAGYAPNMLAQALALMARRRWMGLS